MGSLTNAPVVCHILTADLERSTRFYRDVLGLTPGNNDEYGNVFEMNGGVVRITYIPDFKAGEHPALGWTVKDVRETAKELEAHGVSMLIYEGFGQDEKGIWTSPDGQARVAWFHDPDKNVLSLTD